MNKTPLYEEHLKLGAKMTPFGGWDMPLQYQGIVAEHLHTRHKAGLFDICHMGEFEVEGQGAAEALGKVLTCYPESIPIGKCRYGMMLNESGATIDDVITYRLAENKFMLVVNAGTREGDYRHLQKHLGQICQLKDCSDELAKLDLQGAMAPQVLKDVLDFDLGSLKYFEWTNFRNGLISRTGYTGEWGVEIYCPVSEVVGIWNELLSHELVEPIGLGARDTVRLECGMSLYGHELDDQTPVLYCGVDRFVKWDTDFIGRQALESIKNQPEWQMIGLKSPNKSAPRAGEKVVLNGEVVGEVTSGSLSPCLEVGIALARVKTEVANEKEFSIDKGRRQAPVMLAEIPFYVGTARKKIG